MKDNRDALDYGEMRVSKLFYKLFFPPFSDCCPPYCSTLPMASS